jgi:hypothetical protein
MKRWRFFTQSVLLALGALTRLATSPSVFVGIICVFALTMCYFTYPRK